MATLLFKVFALSLKTASKPLAAQFERYVMGHPVLRQRTIALAQYLHRLDVRVTRGAEGKSGRVFVGDMSEDNAVQLASKAVSEGFIYGTAIVLLLLESDRRRKEEAAKKANSAAEKQENVDRHQRHVDAEAELRKQQDNLQDALERIDERLMMLEEHILNGQEQHRRRWLFF